MTRHTALQWLERGLLAAGVGLGAWCAAVLVEAQFHNSLAVSAPLTITQTVLLPGDTGAPARRSASAAALASGSLLGRLAAPSVNMSTTVLEGSDDATLSRGSGHIEDTPFPGQPGNVGIAGHRDTTFRPLRNIHIGDALEFTTPDRVYRYRISKMLIVGPDDVYVLDPTDHPMLTLVTCYPFEFVGHAPRRFIVQAQLVGEETPAGR
jgi:sortase A